MNKQQLTDKLASYGQEHLLQYWDELAPQQQAEFAAQIEAVDFALMQSLYQGKVDQPDWAELSARAEPPPAVRLEQQTGQANEAAITRAKKHSAPVKWGCSAPREGRGVGSDSRSLRACIRLAPSLRPRCCRFMSKK